MPLTLTHNSYTTEEARREIRLKAVFMRNGPYQVQGFVPGTGIGKFDLKFDPTTNRIDVTVKFAYRFSQDLGKPEQIAWDSGEETRFRLAAKPLIESMWSDAYTITSARPGWHDVCGNVHIDFKEVALDQAAYIVAVMRLAKFKSSGGINHGVVPHLCGVNNFACDADTGKNQTQLFNYKEGIIRNHLRDMGIAGTGDYLPFAKGSKELSVESRLAIVKWCGKVRSMLTPELAGIRAFVVGFAGHKDSAFSSGLKTGRAEATADFINQAFGRAPEVPFAEVLPETSPLVSQAVALLRGRAAPPGSTGNPRIGFGGALVVIGTRTPEERILPFKYVVMAHEFGHMLGLPDEYMGVHDNLTQSLSSLDSIIPKTYQATALSTDGDTVRLRGMQRGLASDLQTAGVAMPHMMGMTGDGDRLSTLDRVAKKEDFYVRRDEARERFGGSATSEGYQTWKRRNLEPTPPASMTTISDSIMHSGNQIQPCHYVTIWSALCKATSSFIDPDQWKIVPTSGKPSTIGFFKART